MYYISENTLGKQSVALRFAGHGIIFKNFKHFFFMRNTSHIFFLTEPLEPTILTFLTTNGILIGLTQLPHLLSKNTSKLGSKEREVVDNANKHGQVSMGRW
jgi:hypothetical protein